VALRRLVEMADVLLPSLEDVDILWPGRSPEAAVEAMLAGARRWRR
jgi:hypothetical protein